MKKIIKTTKQVILRNMMIALILCAGIVKAQGSSLTMSPNDIEYMAKELSLSDNKDVKTHIDSRSIIDKKNIYSYFERTDNNNINIDVQHLGLSKDASITYTFHCHDDVMMHFGSGIDSVVFNQVITNREYLIKLSINKPESKNSEYANTHKTIEISIIDESKKETITSKTFDISNEQSIEIFDVKQPVKAMISSIEKIDGVNGIMISLFDESRYIKQKQS